MDVGLEFDACAGEGGFAFLEDAAHGMERASDGFAEAGNGGVENEAIAVALEPVEVASAGRFVFGKMDALNGESPLHTEGGTGEFAGEADIE